MPQQQIKRGRLKIYFGYAPGVGKTHQMLEDAQELKAHGVDLVVGCLQARGRADILDAVKRLEVIPLKRLPYRSGTTEELDIHAILQRCPQACVIDELAHSGVDPLRHKRWEDVQALLEGGIDVLTTMNVQDLASLSDQVWQITGVRVRETVPDWVFQKADDVVMVDVTPRALLHRLQRGAIYAPERAWAEAQQIFREPVLVALRELAMRQTAQALEARQTARTKEAEGRGERILVNITADASTAMVLRRARRVADYLQADCVAVCVHTESDFARLPTSERQAINRHFRFADGLRIRTNVVQGRSRARALVNYARKNGITQIFLSRTLNAPKKLLSGADFTQQVIEHARGLAVMIIAERIRDGKPPSAYPEDEAGSLMHSGYVSVPPEATVEAALSEMRRQAGQVEMIFYTYVIDASQQLKGVASLRQLLAAEREKTVGSIMNAQYVSVQEDDDVEDAAQLLVKHRLLAVPVLDRERRMCGILTSADLVGIVQQEAGEDIQKIGGMEALDGPYLQVSFAQMVKKRAGWLAILFVGEMLTATALSYFSDEIEKAVVLALFLPLIISSGGNSGSQATTLVIRAMAMGEVRLRDWWKVISRELAAGLALGTILGVIGITRILLWHSIHGAYGPHYAVIAATIGCSLVGVVMFGTIAGSMLPFILRRCGLDPASASAPFVATLVDVTGLIIYFTIANLILRGTLL